MIQRIFVALKVWSGQLSSWFHTIQQNDRSTFYVFLNTVFLTVAVCIVIKLIYSRALESQKTSISFNYLMEVTNLNTVKFSFITYICRVMTDHVRLTFHLHHVTLMNSTMCDCQTSQPSNSL